MTAFERCYRILLRAYPRVFRRRYADDMEAVFRLRLDRARRERGWRGALACWVAAFCDLLANAAGERLHTADLIGSRPSTIQALRSRKGDAMLSRVVPSFRFAFRALRRQPLATVTIVLTLAVGTGATIAIFSVVDAALVRPLPYPDADRLAALVQQSEEFGEMAFAPPFLEDLRMRAGGFSAMAGFSASGWSMALTGVGEPRVVMAAYVSDGLFEMLGVRPADGRLFSDDEYRAETSTEVLVSRSLWARTFGEGTPLRGQSIRLGGRPYSVVGVLPEGFSLPITGSVVSNNRQSADVLLPFGGLWAFRMRNVPIMNVIGRLAPGVGFPEAGAEVEALRPALAADFPDAGLGSRFVVVPLAELVTRASRSTVLMLFGAAGLLLVIACVNVANIMLARTTARRQEIAVRRALGAGRARLAEQILTEALLLAGLGCGVGLLLAGALLRAAPTLGLQALPPSARVGLDVRVVVFAALLSLACTAAFGLAPSLYGSRMAPFDGERTAARGSRVQAHRARGVLVVAQVALAVVLLVGAGLLLSSFVRLTGVDPGFRSEGLVAVPLSIADAGFDTGGARAVFVGDLLERFESIRGVAGVAAVNRLPLGGSNVLVEMEAEGQARPEDVTTVDRRVVTDGYFDTMGIERVAGRDFTAADDAAAEFGAAIVNVTAARTFWPGGLDPVGRRLRLMLRGGPGPWLTVVGVVADVRHHGLDQAPRAEIYVPYAQASVETMVALLRLERGTATGREFFDTVKLRARELSAELPMDGITRVDDVVASSVSEPRLRTAILTLFGALAVALAGIGVGGVVSYAVVRRRRDIAVRVALGARRRQILAHTVRDGMMLGGFGVIIGLLAASQLTRLLDSLLFGVGPQDPLTFAAVGALLLMFVAAASYLPALQATRVEPNVVLRSE